MSNLIILIVADRPIVLDSVERVVEQWPNTDIYLAEDFIAAAMWINSMQRLDLLLSDVCLPGEMSGMDVADVAVKTHPEVAVLLFSDDDLSEIAGTRGRYEFVRRPIDCEQLTTHIDNAFSKLHASAEWLLKFSTQENILSESI